MVAEKTPHKTSPRISAKKISRTWIYEIIDGKPVYYNGYKEVLAGKKTIGEIRGASSLQSTIIEYLLTVLFLSLDLKKYRILTNEAGLHLNRQNNLSGDIIIYERDVLPVKDANKNYLAIPPKIQIEVDINADLGNFESVDDYLHIKTNKLLSFGVEKVIWVTSNSKKVMIATPHDNWQVIDWHKPIEVLDQISFNIGQYLKD